MNITGIAFSPTGGTKRILQILSESMGTIVKEIDLTDRNMPSILTSLAAQMLKKPCASRKQPELVI